MQTHLTTAGRGRRPQTRLETLAVVVEAPEQLAIQQLDLTPPSPEDVVVEVAWSGISTGTERLLWTGRMPHFPGMGYPLVPGYETVGRISEAGEQSGRSVGEHVFVPGAACFGEVRGLFGGAAARLVVAGHRVIPIAEKLAERGTLLALAATARHAIERAERPPELVVGHGVLGRLIARLLLAAGHPAPVVWETNPKRSSGAQGYRVCHPDEDDRRDYRTICDVSGDGALIDPLIGRLAKGGELLLAGFYTEPLSVAFPPAFMREARLTIAAEWQPADLAAVQAFLADGRLDLDGLITHRCTAQEAATAYRTAFGDADCLKMILDWRASHE